MPATRNGVRPGGDALPPGDARSLHASGSASCVDELAKVRLLWGPKLLVEDIDTENSCGSSRIVTAGQAAFFTTFFQESITRMYSTDSNDLLIWGVRKLIEREFPCVFNRDEENAKRSTEDQSLDRSMTDSEKCCSGPQNASLPAALENGEEHLFLGLKLSSPTAQQQQRKAALSLREVAPPGTSLLTNCVCGGIAGGPSCEERQIVVAAVEGRRQRDWRLLKWVRNNVLKSGDILVLVTAWERAEDPKYLQVPGLILSSCDNARSYNVATVIKLERRLQHLAAALFSDCFVYPLVAPLTRPSKAAVGRILCQAAAGLQANVLVLGSHGHTSLRQVLCGSVSRHVRLHAACKVVTPRV